MVEAFFYLMVGFMIGVTVMAVLTASKNEES